MAKRITINGKWTFYETPLSCGDCKCSINDNLHEAGGKSFCVLFGKQKNYYDTPPKRCVEMFKKAFAIGGDVALVEKE
ncbi:hypothetical protein [Sodaliphilus pleomorphus]|uniref:Uncharacterized protein n=1 Tax=Sodaliphilus pleomorphus TaxID=2606626 RepID=A0A6L5X9V6_9BACT|nr:hypothetical protein [Sodaliphilus pleomorphus]MSS16225.1 hypothetical protein [Sodaliphilus pleomorphus]